jgi:hypothetical protein
MNIATKYQIAVAVRIADCPLVLTITKVEERTYRNPDGTDTTADTLIGVDERRTFRAVRLNRITVEQLVRLLGPETDAWTGRRVLVSTTQKGDKAYIAFAQAPAAPVTAPTFLSGTGNGTVPHKDNTQHALNPETQAAIGHLEQTMRS